jgi:hypothetical protein
VSDVYLPILVCGFISCSAQKIFDLVVPELVFAYLLAGGFLNASPGTARLQLQASRRCEYGDATALSS